MNTSSSGSKQRTRTTQSSHCFAEFAVRIAKYDIQTADKRAWMAGEALPQRADIDANKQICTHTHTHVDDNNFINCIVCQVMFGQVG